MIAAAAIHEAIDNGAKHRRPQSLLPGAEEHYQYLDKVEKVLEKDSVKPPHCHVATVVEVEKALQKNSVQPPHWV